MRFLADENFSGRILRGLLRENPNIDVIRVQNTSLYQAEDQLVLEWAAKEGRVLLTHDIETMRGFAYDRVTAGLPLAGVFLIRGDAPIGQVIEDLLIVAGASDVAEWQQRVEFVPF
jgi:predicted nuclease of predicted toxin-antitoxin system